MVSERAMFRRGLAFDPSPLPLQNKILTICYGRLILLLTVFVPLSGVWYMLIHFLLLMGFQVRGVLSVEDPFSGFLRHHKVLGEWSSNMCPS